MVHKTNRSRLLRLWLVSAKSLLAAVAVTELLFQAVSHRPKVLFPGIPTSLLLRNGW